MTQRQKNEKYGLYLLEEIRALLAQNLLVTARLRDDYWGYTDTDERTYKDAFKEVDESKNRMDELSKELENES